VTYFLSLMLAAMAAVVATAGAAMLAFAFIGYCIFEDKPKTLMAGLFIMFVSIGMVVMHQGGVVQ
jgi:hypothetical protein